MPNFNDRIRQLLLLLTLLFLVFLVVKELLIFLPGLLGALTLYILSRARYFQLVYNRKWKKGLAAGLFIFYYLVLLGLPIYLAISLIGPKINSFLNDPTTMVNSAKSALVSLQEKTGYKLFSERSLTES